MSAHRQPTTVIRNAGDLARTPRHVVALEALAAGIEAAHPRRVLSRRVDRDGDVLCIDDRRIELAWFDGVTLLGGGKPAGEAASALAAHLGDRLDGGIVVTDQPVETPGVEMVEGTHPLPSGTNQSATNRLLGTAEGLAAGDLAVVVIGGGASALLFAPVADVPMEAYRRVVDDLLRAGAAIEELNAVRKHLSTVKGGRLAQALTPATVIGIVFSDVVGDRLDVIASGPTAPDPSTFEMAQAVIADYDVDVAPSIERHLDRGVRGDIDETPTAEHPCFERVEHHVLANASTAIEGAADAIQAADYDPILLGDDVEGEARAVGRDHARVAREYLDPFVTSDRPIALLSGGEATVTVEGEGAGGPNQEFVLSCAGGLTDTDVLVAAVDTDGIDGSSDFAGAILTGAEAAGCAGLDDALDRNDAHRFCVEHGVGILTGPTGTNVNDLRLLLVEPEVEG